MLLFNRMGVAVLLCGAMNNASRRVARCLVSRLHLNYNNWNQNLAYLEQK